MPNKCFDFFLTLIPFSCLFLMRCGGVSPSTFKHLNLFRTLCFLTQVNTCGGVAEVKEGAVETPPWESRFGPKLYSFWWFVFTILTFFTVLFFGGAAWLCLFKYSFLCLLMSTQAVYFLWGLCRVFRILRSRRIFGKSLLRIFDTLVMLGLWGGGGN